METFEIIKRQEGSMTDQAAEIKRLHDRCLNQIHSQDLLYKDYIKVERNFRRKEESLKDHVRHIEDELMESNQKQQKLELTINTITSGTPADKASAIMELTKQNAILDLNLLRLTRKYQSLEEQERMLRREYHNKDADIAEKDVFVQERISKLKEWKVRAIQ